MAESALHTSPSQLGDSDADRHGEWLRRRQLAGADKEVPINFYPDIWKVLHRCHGLSIMGNMLPQRLTKELTANEMKFALQVEMALNKIPQPEFRQLTVEAMAALITMVNEDITKNRWPEVIYVDRLVYKANDIFISEQSKMDGNVMLCCGQERPTPLKCGGTAGICQNFYDMAPSGRYGTMAYIWKAVLTTLHIPTQENGNVECVVS